MKINWTFVIEKLLAGWEAYDTAKKEQDAKAAKSEEEPSV